MQLFLGSQRAQQRVVSSSVEPLIFGWQPVRDQSGAQFAVGQTTAAECGLELPFIQFLDCAPGQSEQQPSNTKRGSSQQQPPSFGEPIPAERSIWRRCLRWQAKWRQHQCQWQCYQIADRAAYRNADGTQCELIPGQLPAGVHHRLVVLANSIYFS